MAEEETTRIEEASRTLGELKETARGAQKTLQELQGSFTETRTAFSAMQASVGKLQVPGLALATSIAQSVVEYKQERALQQQRIDVTKSQIAEIEGTIASIQQEKRSIEESLATNAAGSELKKQERAAIERNIESLERDIAKQRDSEQLAKESAKYVENLRKQNAEIQSQLATIPILTDEEAASKRELIAANESQLSKLKQLSQMPLTRGERSVVGQSMGIDKSIANMSNAKLLEHIATLEASTQAEKSLLDSVRLRAELLEEQSTNEASITDGESNIKHFQEAAKKLKDASPVDQLKKQQTLLEKKNDQIKKDTDQQESLTNQLKKKQEEETKYTTRLGSLQETLAKQEAVFNKNTELFRTLATIADKIGKSLLELDNAIRQTQQQFGIAAGSAARLKFDDIIQTFESNLATLFSGGAQAAVSSQERMAARSSFQAEFGGVISTDAAENIARQAKEMGVTTQQLASARRIFMTQTGNNLGQATVAQDRLIATFEKRGLTSKDAMEAITKNSEIFARNGTRFADSFTKAAANAKQIGVDLGKIDQVGDNIIGNFEGFLEKQAELGAMGFNLDSSRLAELAESGDTGALFDELRTQLAGSGKDINNLRRSEQLALSGAFGIPISELQRMTAPGGGSGEKMEDLQKAGNSFLERLVNLLQPLGTILGVISAAITGVIAFLLMRIQANTFIMAGRGLFGGAPGGAGAARGGAGAARGGAGAAQAGAGAARGGAGVASKLGGLAKGTGRFLGRAAVPLAAVLDFSNRKSEGQSTTKAGVGTAGGVAGGLAGAKLGAMAGAAIGSIVPGVGTAIGGAVGGLLGGTAGYFAGGKLADKAMDAVQSTDNQAPTSISQSINAVPTTSPQVTPQSFINDPALVRPEVFEKMATSLSAIATTLQVDHTAFFTKLVANTSGPTPPSPAAGEQGVTPSTTPTTQPVVTPPQIVVDFGKLEDKLDAVVRAISSMKVQMDGTEVGKVLVNVSQATAQLGPMRPRGQSTYASTG